MQCIVTNAANETSAAVQVFCDMTSNIGLQFLERGRQNRRLPGTEHQQRTEQMQCTAAFCSPWVLQRKFPLFVLLRQRHCPFFYHHRYL